MTSRRMATIHVIHPSIRRWAGARRPHGMSQIVMDEDTLADLTGIALSIFADCANVGVPFQDAILAVYLSGLHHGGSS